MLTPVPTPPKAVGDYAAVVGRDVVTDLRERAKKLEGARILHINSTAYGGGVAELLTTLVPLARDLGLDVEWRLMRGDDKFFGITKAMHNALQGGAVPWTKEMRAHYSTVTEDNAEDFVDDYDFVIVHDPQPAGMLKHLLEDRGGVRGTWIWRCHIDLTEPFMPVWKFLAPQVSPYEAAVFTLEEFVPPGLRGPQLSFIAPSIDPLSLKNVPMDDGTIREVLRYYSIDERRPLLVQVSRFDPWKDPLGVIDAYRIVKKKVPEVQLALIASMASDDPEGWEWYERTLDHRAGDPDIFLLSNLQEVGNLAVNAFQRAASVVIQKSIREGFGLVVTEGMWKSKPVVAGNVGGIRLQIEDGKNGFLVDSAEQCADRILAILRDPMLGRRLGRAARRTVREQFLSTRQLAEELALLASLPG